MAGVFHNGYFRRFLSEIFTKIFLWGREHFHSSLVLDDLLLSRFSCTAELNKLCLSKLVQYIYNNQILVAIFYVSEILYSSAKWLDMHVITVYKRSEPQPDLASRFQDAANVNSWDYLYWTAKETIHRHYVYLLLHVYQYPNKINNSLNSVQFQLIWWNFI